MFDIQEELKKLPQKPGVYLMKDENGHIIYVGKAVNLKNRVRQYFQSSRNQTAKTRSMVPNIREFEYIVTDSEMEALLLECNLIKKHHPYYNILLKDDKSYPYIKVTVQEMFPRIFITRRMEKDKAKYYGPFTDVLAAKETVETLHKLFPIRKCKKVFPRDIGKERPCLNHHIGQCIASCSGRVPPEEYQVYIKDAMDFLEGKHHTIMKKMEQEMLMASENMEFERAAALRDKIAAIKSVAEKQKISNTGLGDADVIGFVRAYEECLVQVFFIRDGRLIGRDHFYLRIAQGDENAEILSSFIKQFYAGTPYIPGELMLPVEPEEREILEAWLGEKRGHKVHFRIPKKGEKEKLVELAAKNAKMVLEKDKERIKREEGRTIGAVKEIEKLLGLNNLVRMEAYDISNTNGFASVGSMIVYERGKPKRNDYRKFHIKGVQGADDYASMREVLTRRFRHGLEEQKSGKELGSFNVFPDLIMMDGGKGQVNIALEVLDELHISIPVCGMVKDDHHRTRGLYYQNIEIPIDRNSEGFRLITRVQDEAHRFAIEFHRKLRSQGQVHSILDDIPGIGPARRKALMRTFASLDEIKNAEVEELKKIPSMDEKSAKNVYNFFRGSEKEDTEATLMEEQ